MGQLGLFATTIEPALWSPGAATVEPKCCSYGSPHALGPVLRDKRSHHNEKLVHRT